MAKSLRSKRKRKMRALKRERVYGPKELARLKQTVSTAAAAKLAATAEAADAEMSELATVRPAAEVVKELQAKREAAASDYDAKTLRDAHGCYPPWMNQRRIRQHRAQLQKAASGKKSTAKPTAPKRSSSKKKTVKKKSVW